MYSNCEIMNNLLKRKREDFQPALISVTENIDVPKYNVINSPKFTIGRSAEANLQLLITCVSRTHCSFLFDDNKNEWSILSHSKKSIYVGGKPLNTNESLPVKCGDEIRLTSFLTFQFKCSPSPDTQWKCCADIKNAKLSIVEKMKNFDVENVIVIDDDDDSDPNVISETPKIFSQLPDSSSADNHDIYENPMPSCSGVIFSPQSKFSFPLTIKELKKEIFAYGGREIKNELFGKLRYIEKLKQSNETCRLYFSDPAENFRLGSLLNDLSNFFEDENSKSKVCDRNTGEKLDVKLFNIIVNLDAILMEQTKLAMSFMQKFLQPASYGTPERLIMKTREKEDILMRLDAMTDDKKMAEMKMKLDNYDILEYEFKILEEDKRAKDDLQKKVKTLEEQINVLNYDNAQLLNDICSTADQIAKLKEKCDSLEKKVELKAPVPSTSSAGMFPAYGKYESLHHPAPITMPIPMSMAIPMPVNSMPSSTFTPIPTSTNKSHYLPGPLQIPMPTPTVSPFEIVKLLLSTPITTEDGRVIRKAMLEHGVVETILECLAILAHNNSPCKITSKPELKNIINYFKQGFTATPQLTAKRTKKNSGKSQYWAKGTGYGTGDTSTSWDAQESIRKKQLEEENITALLLTIAAYINPDNILTNSFDIIQIGEVNFAVDDPALPIKFFELIENSALLPILLSYLRNDSVLDMARHIPLYRAVMVLLRVFAFNTQLVKFFLPADCRAGSSSSSNSRNSNSLIEALESMKANVDAYASTLLKNKPADFQLARAAQSNVEGGEEFNSLISDIQATAIFVEMNTQRVTKNVESVTPQQLASSSTEEIYLRLMKKLQFDTYGMIVENAENDGFVFSISYHYEKRLRMDEGKNHPNRMKRLAQEVSTLRTSLPLSFSSSVFVRTDDERLDMMKVLIIGPAETPYMNGCFEFDVYFPPNYPNEPMLINLETTGRHTVRFNPNLYKDGKVCLSILNTWAGRPEEKWNAQTSSFLQVLVSIQSLILVPDPYFNEPGYERMRSTVVGNRSSREYNANIRQATVKWAMLDQLINPSPCFETIIQKHFFLKKNEICNQITGWLNETEKSGASNFRTNVNNLKKAIEDLEVTL